MHVMHPSMCEEKSSSHSKTIYHAENIHMGKFYFFFYIIKYLEIKNIEVLEVKSMKLEAS